MSTLTTVSPDAQVITMVSMKELVEPKSGLWFIWCQTGKVDEDGLVERITLALDISEPPLCFISEAQAKTFIATMLRSDTGLVTEQLMSALSSAKVIVAIGLAHLDRPLIVYLPD